MNHRPEWRQLGYQHPLWDLLRFYRSLRRSGDAWLAQLKTGVFGDFPVAPEHIKLVDAYIAACRTDAVYAFECLRMESEALTFCQGAGVEVGITRTKNEEHHQSAKALVAAVGYSAQIISSKFGLKCDPNPQRRTVWFDKNNLHVTARNLDGAIPSLENPFLVWEIKEYWGTTKGGSKMSDAVYECNLVGLELRQFEARAKRQIVHVVFLDGKEQWGFRKSDLTRFIDLFHQGIIDQLFIGREVQCEWPKFLEGCLARVTQSNL